LDLAKEQFPEGTVIPKGTQMAVGYGFDSNREFLLSGYETKMRYEFLKRRVEYYLSKKE
jgi:hypothetical protein